MMDEILKEFTERIEKDHLKDTRFKSYGELEDEIHISLVKLTKIFLNELNTPPSMYFIALCKFAVAGIATHECIGGRESVFMRKMMLEAVGQNYDVVYKQTEERIGKRR